MTDIHEDALTKGLGTISYSLGRLLKKERITEEQRDAALGRLSTSTDMSAVADCDIIVEAATEAEATRVADLTKQVTQLAATKQQLHVDLEAQQQIQTDLRDTVRKGEDQLVAARQQPGLT